MSPYSRVLFFDNLVSLVKLLECLELVKRTPSKNKQKVTKSTV